DAEEAIAGQRVALNLQGIEKNEIERGTIIGKPDTLMLSNRLDATLRYLKLPFKPIKNDSILRFQIAATQEEARIVLLNRDVIEPGEELFAQFVFANPIVALPGDRYILRGSYAIQTIGGGEILDIMPGKHKRNTVYIDSTYKLLTEGNFMDKTEYHIAKGGYEGIKREMLSILLGKDETHVSSLIENLVQHNKAILIGKTVIHMDKFIDYKKTLEKLLDDFHTKNPQKIGISKEELRTRLPKVESQVFQAALEECIAEGNIEVEKDKVRIRDAGGKVDKEREHFVEDMIKKLHGYGLMPPHVKELAIELHKPENYVRDSMERLVYEGKVIKVKGDMYFHRNVIEDFKEKVLTYLRANKEMTPSDFKSTLNLSRKYMIPLLEYLDEIKLTIRTGDKRILRS
ncbi:MAG: SelB C-terminal domain-containing protein, partial [Proteobacteria bacterium]|nr:SelB C-terminal domain-containing protein [Pseudomonadota bacterium]